MTTLERTLIATLKDIRYTLDLAQMGYEINTIALIKIVDETLQIVETPSPEITESSLYRKIEAELKRCAQISASLPYSGSGSINH